MPYQRPKRGKKLYSGKRRGKAAGQKDALTAFKEEASVGKSTVRFAYLGESARKPEHGVGDGGEERAVLEKRGGEKMSRAAPSDHWLEHRKSRTEGKKRSHVLSLRRQKKDKKK